MYNPENIGGIYHGHVLDVLAGFPDNSLDMCITSPPYYGLRAYGSEPVVWEPAPPLHPWKNCKHEWSDEIKINTPDNFNNGFNERWGNSPGAKKQEHTRNYKQISQGNFCIHCNAWKGELGLEPTYQLYLFHLKLIFAEVKRVVKDTGTIWVNIGDSYGGSGGNSYKSPQTKNNHHIVNSMPDASIAMAFQPKSLLQIPERFSIMMTDELGLIKRNTIIWFKKNCMPSSADDRFTVDFEPVYFYSIKPKYYFEQQFESIAESTIGRGPVDFGGKKGREYKPDKNDPNYRNGSEQWGKTFDYTKSCKQGRNKRTVWQINTEPFSEAHFAVFPQSLVETPIRAGCPEFICNKCGNALLRQKAREQGKEYVNEQKFTGYTDCGCNAGFHAGTVLDPFGGSGTVGVVAKKLNRNYVLIDVKQDYVDMQHRRIEKECGGLI